jgi:hypothetical protein
MLLNFPGRGINISGKSLFFPTSKLATSPYPHVIFIYSARGNNPKKQDITAFFPKGRSFDIAFLEPTYMYIEDEVLKKKQHDMGAKIFVYIQSESQIGAGAF